MQIDSYGFFTPSKWRANPFRLSSLAFVRALRLH
jgi:hypothetical protein